MIGQNTEISEKPTVFKSADNKGNCAHAKNGGAKPGKFRASLRFLVFYSSLPCLSCFKQNTLLTEESGGRKTPAGFLHFLLRSDGFLSLSRLLSQVSCRQSTAGRATPSYSSPIRRTRQELRYSTVYSPTAGF